MENYLASSRFEFETIQQDRWIRQSQSVHNTDPRTNEEVATGDEVVDESGRSLLEPRTNEEVATGDEIVDESGCSLLGPTTYVEVSTGDEVVDENGCSIVQLLVYGRDSFTVNDYDDLIEYAESSDNEEVTNNHCDLLLEPRTYEGVATGDEVVDESGCSLLEPRTNEEVATGDEIVDENGCSIVQSLVYGRDSFTVNDYDDLIEYAESSDNGEVTNNCDQELNEGFVTHSDREENFPSGDSGLMGRSDYENLVDYGESSTPGDQDLNGSEYPNQSTNQIVDEPAEVDDAPVVGQGRPKRGRKRKILHQSRTDRKKLYNTNKKHINTKGKIVQEKVFDENFVCQCTKKCTVLVSLELRKRLFHQFQSMGTFSGRCAILINCASERPKKRSYSTTPMKNRVMTRKYTMFGHNVCKVALLRTLQINQKRLATALNKQMFFDTFADCRGKARGGANAFPLEKRVEVRAHVASFPKYISHYTRSQTDSKFLSSTLNLAKMYALYKIDAENPVSKSFYKRVFYEDFNLRFKVPKKDTCLRCDIYQTKIKNPILTEADRLIIEEWHNEHLEQAELLQKQMANDLAMAKIDDSLEVLPFDFQKMLSMPKLTTSIVYYKRQLNLYNFGIHVGSTGKGIFNVWIETEASKGTQEVGSCLKKYIATINGPKQLILWSDACGGQNRSFKLILMLVHILQNHPTLETISMRYLQSGHSFLPNDSEFGDFECALKCVQQLSTDVAVIDVMKSCRIENKFIVNRMSTEDFFSVKNLEKEITNRKTDLNKNKVNWLETHEILIEKSQPGIIKMKKKIDGVFQSVSIEKRGGNISSFGTIDLDQLWTGGRPLSKEKVADLKEILKLVPDEDKHFYSFLNTTPVADFIDDIDGFGETIDFELEEY